MGAEPARRIVGVANDPIRSWYRLIVPIRALIDTGRATGTTQIGVSQGLEAAASSVIVTQRDVAFPAAVSNAMKHDAIRLIHDFDDLVWSAPNQAPARQPFDRIDLDGVVDHIGRVDLVTVSNEPLADALRQRGFDPIVLPNTVDPRDWTVQPRRAEHKRARIGWYGRRGLHARDLAIIAPAVRALIHAADFVFFGDLPAELNDLADRIEMHGPVSRSCFPAMLAALDFDLVLAPLVNDAFNDCRSNIALLAAGMLGYPVIATDIAPYQTLPVMRVANTIAGWTAAISDRIGELPALRRDGEELRRAVHARFLISDWAERYLAHWTGHALMTTHA